MECPLVSVIVPAYNAEKYLPAAIESVLRQTYSGWELILVDDGSTDSTPAICDKAAAADPRVRVIHKPNGGVSCARNAAMEIAAGSYFTFLDADDLLASRCLETMVGVAQKERVEMVASPLHLSNDDSDFTSWNEAEAAIVDSTKLVEEILYQTCMIECSASGKLYGRNLWDSIRFREDMRYEDLDVFYRVILSVEKVAVVPQPLYFYRQHPDSYIHTFTRKRADVLDVTDRLLAWMRENRPQLIPAAEDRRMSAHFNILSLLYKNHVRDKALEERCWRVIRAQRTKSLRNPKVRLKNRVGAFIALAGGRRMVRLLSRFY